MSSLPKRAVIRPVESADQPFLYELFCASRPDLVGLPEPLVQMQFRAQSQSYSAQFPAAEQQIVLLMGRPIGRLLVDRSPECIHLVDIALLPTERGQGIGAALLRSLQAEAVQAALPLRLSVFVTNPARRLYERLGFTEIADQPPYIALQWLPPTGGTACST